MTKTQESLQGAAQFPRGDVIGILLEQHAQIRELFQQVHSASGESKRQLFGDLRRLLAVHEVAEEMILRPATRAATGGSRVAGARNAEESRATRMLANLEKMDPSSPRFPAAFTELEKNVAEHAQREESDEFPLILATRSAQHRAWMGWALRGVQALAPTHPHASAAGSTAAQYLLGPIASLLDHARDAAKKVLPG